jgi:hypothetical protein
MVLKRGVRESKRRRRRGNKKVFFCFERRIGRARNICGRKP